MTFTEGKNVTIFTIQLVQELLSVAYISISTILLDDNSHDKKMITLFNNTKSVGHYDVEHIVFCEKSQDLAS
jgi:hypothetical protein